LLGGALLGQKKYKEAELLLLSGYEGMKPWEATVRVSKSTSQEALQRLVELCEETNARTMS
jgi:hypothetical protein